jgi:hypothetical protein
MKPCKPVEFHSRFGGVYRLHLARHTLTPNMESVITPNVAERVPEYPASHPEDGSVHERPRENHRPA